MPGSMRIMHAKVDQSIKHHFFIKICNHANKHSQLGSFNRFIWIVNQLRCFWLMISNRWLTVCSSHWIQKFGHKLLLKLNLKIKLKLTTKDGLMHADASFVGFWWHFRLSINLPWGQQLQQWQWQQQWQHLFIHAQW